MIKTILLSAGLFASTCQVGPFDEPPDDPTAFPPEPYDSAKKPVNCPDAGPCPAAPVKPAH